MAKYEAVFTERLTHRVVFEAADGLDTEEPESLLESQWFDPIDEQVKDWFKYANVDERELVSIEKIEKIEDDADTTDCDHDKHEDCMNCRICGKCSETLDSDDVCSDCGGKDES